MVWRSKENVVTFLLTIKNTSFIRKELKQLKKEKIYPYPIRKKVLKSNERVGLHRYLKLLQAIEPFFWIEHFVYKLYYAVKYKNR